MQKKEQFIAPLGKKKKIDVVVSNVVCNILKQFSFHTSKAMHSSDNTHVSKFKVPQPVLEEKQ